MGDVFFGIQLALPSRPGSPWRQRLGDLVRRHQRDLRLDDKRGLYGAASNILRDAVGSASLAYWDFVPDGNAEFTEWVQGIEDDTGTPWVPDAGAPNDHFLVSVLFLLADGGQAAELCGERCDIPEADWQRQSTYRHLVETVGMLRFGSVRSDGIYLTPGGSDLGFSLRELLGADYGYLLPLV